MIFAFLNWYGRTLQKRSREDGAVDFLYDLLARSLSASYVDMGVLMAIENIEQQETANPKVLILNRIYRFL